MKFYPQHHAGGNECQEKGYDNAEHSVLYKLGRLLKNKRKNHYLILENSLVNFNFKNTLK